MSILKCQISKDCYSKLLQDVYLYERLLIIYLNCSKWLYIWNHINYFRQQFSNSQRNISQLTSLPSSQTQHVGLKLINNVPVVHWEMLGGSQNATRSCIAKKDRTRDSASSFKQRNLVYVMVSPQNLVDFDKRDSMLSIR